MIDAIYLFAVLPQAHDFEMLVLAFAPVFLILGALTSMPATALAAGPISFIAASLLALSSSYNADFVSYANSAASSIFGLGATAIIIRIFRSVSAEWTAWRLLRRNCIDVATIAANQNPATLDEFAALMLDRLGLVVPRLALSLEGADNATAAALADVRVGVNIIGLQRDAVHLPDQLRRAIRTMLDAIAAHYRRHSLDRADASLLNVIDRVIATAVQDPATKTRELLLQLGGIRRGLFPNAPPYVHATALEMSPDNDRGTQRLWRFRSSTPDVGRVALPLTAALRRLLRWFGFYRIVWHRPLVDLALLVIVLGAVVVVATLWGPQ